VNAAEAQEVGLLETGNRAENCTLRPRFKACLETDQVPHLRGAIFLAQLHHRIRLAARLGIDEADGLHRPKAQGLDPTLRHLFNRQTALEIRHLVPLVAGDVLLTPDKGCHKRLVLFLSKWRVPVVVASALAVARSLEEPCVVERVGGDDRRDRVVEGE
jgi:hypothetical protein